MSLTRPSLNNLATGHPTMAPSLEVSFPSALPERRVHFPVQAGSSPNAVHLEEAGRCASFAPPCAAADERYRLYESGYCVHMASCRTGCQRDFPQRLSSYANTVCRLDIIRNHPTT